MEVLLLGLHALCVLYILARALLAGGGFGAEAAFWALGYATLAVLPAVPRARAAKVGLCALLVGASLLAARASPLAAFALPLPVARLMLLLEPAAPIEAAAYLLPPLLLAMADPWPYLLSSALCLAVRRAGSRLESRAAEGERSVDALEAANQALSRALARQGELDGERERFIVLEERNRIAQDLHDELGHTIAGGLAQLEAAKVVLGDDPGRAERLIDAAAAALNGGMRSIRASLRSMKPRAEDMGLQGIRSLLAEFERGSGRRAALSVAGDLGALDPLLWRTIAENFREALTNVLRHSDAREVRAEVAAMNRVIKAAIADDGEGCAAPLPGMGLRGMEERTRAAGGTLIVDGSAGFSVIMIFPRGGPDEDTRPDRR